MSKDDIMDIHNHTNWSDGDSSIEDLVINALENNIGIIGISDHYNNKHTRSIINFEDYILEIEILKNKYLSQIKILSGVEIPISSILCQEYSLKLINNLDFVLVENIENLPPHFNLELLEEHLKNITCKKGLAHTNLQTIAAKYKDVGGINYFIEFMKKNDLFFEINSNSSFSFFDDFIYYHQNDWVKELFHNLNL
ncbi:MAG TPA: PHP domain-containing protein, partial [Acetivibrio sp.]|nr:PHP domain-containing protein [Acetivibrio sp.]